MGVIDSVAASAPLPAAALPATTTLRSFLSIASAVVVVAPDVAVSHPLAAAPTSAVASAAVVVAVLAIVASA